MKPTSTIYHIVKCFYYTILLSLIAIRIVIYIYIFDSVSPAAPRETAAVVTFGKVRDDSSADQIYLDLSS